MAQKRMFDRAVIEADKFLNISLTAKALYFLLGMEADDEGFVSPTRVLRLYGGEHGDLKNLIDSGLVIPFKTGVVVITDWHTNNYLDTRRTKPTRYQDEKNQLILVKIDRENTNFTNDKKYVLSIGLAGAQPEENRIEENRREENGGSQSSPPFVYFDYLKKMDEDKREAIQLMAHFFRERELKFDSLPELREAITRHVKAANKVIKFPKDKVFSAIKKCKDKHSDVDWSLETVLKKLTN